MRQREAPRYGAANDRTASTPPCQCPSPAPPICEGRVARGDRVQDTVANTSKNNNNNKQLLREREPGAGDRLDGVVEVDVDRPPAVQVVLGDPGPGHWQARLDDRGTRHALDRAGQVLIDGSVRRDQLEPLGVRADERLPV